jgi:hypothetical protein
MASAGLSLVGFMEQDEALAHLKNVCIPTIQDDALLLTEWQQATANLGPAALNAGTPQVLDIPAQFEPYLANLVAQPWANPYFQTALGNFEFKLLEIDPLIAFQTIIDVTRSAHHCGGLGKSPALDKIIEVCLPQQPNTEQFQTSQASQSILLTTKSLNLQVQAQGMFNAMFMGVQFGLSLPFLQVVEFGGRYFLHNGFHRALGLKAAGVTHLPCILRNVGSYEELGLRAGTFQPALLESDNPPTLRHFTHGLAHQVSLRAVNRVLHVSWSEYVVPIE